MPVLQWGMLCVLSLLLSIGFLAVHLPAALLLGPMIAGIIFSMRDRWYPEYPYKVFRIKQQAERSTCYYRGS